jgi:alpha-glucosidase
MQKLVTSTADNPGDTLFIHIYAGSGTNQFVYYEDDGETYTNENGNFYKRNISYISDNKVVTINKKEGVFSSKFKTITLIFHGFRSSDLNKINLNKSPLRIVQDSHRFFTSYFKFADYGPDDTKIILKTSFQNSDEKMVVNW